MSVTIPQTSYSLTPAAAMAGMVADCDPGQLVQGEFIAAEDLPPGRLVELDPTDTTLKKARLCQTASAAGKFLGVTVYNSADQVGSTKSGNSCRILRRGRIYAEFTGTAGSDMLTALNVNSSSTTATNRGKMTDAGTSAGAGTEVYATKLLAIEETSVSPTGLCCVELNGALQ